MTLGMMSMARGSALTLKDVPTDIRNGVGLALQSPTASADEPSLDIDANEKTLILRALTETRGNRSAAAKVLGISRRTLHRKLHVYGLEES